jgi:hypothetical protein
MGVDPLPDDLKASFKVVLAAGVLTPGHFSSEAIDDLFEAA